MTDDEDVEWDDEGYEDEDEELANEQMQRRREEEELGGHQMMEPDDPMQWADDAVQQRQQAAMSRIPDALQPASVREQQQQAALRAQQQQQWEQQQREQGQKQQQQQPVEQRPEQQTLQYPAQLQPGQSGPANPEIAQPQRDPFEETETRKLTVTPTIAREADERPAGQPYLPSALVAKQQSDDSVKRRLEEEAAEEARKKQKGKMPAPVSSAQGPGAQAPGKLRKNPSKDSDDDGKDKKKVSCRLASMRTVRNQRVLPIVPVQTIVRSVIRPPIQVELDSRIVREVVHGQLGNGGMHRQITDNRANATHTTPLHLRQLERLHDQVLKHN